MPVSDPTLGFTSRAFELMLPRQTQRHDDSAGVMAYQWSNDPERLQKIDSLLGDLQRAARSGDLEAIEILGNLAVAIPRVSGQDDPEQVLREGFAGHAMTLLVNITLDPQTTERARAAVRQFSLQAYEISSNWDHRNLRGPANERVAVDVPTPMLSLAIPEARASGHAESANRIGHQIRERLGEAVQHGDSSFSQPNRFCSFEEIAVTVPASPPSHIHFEKQALITSETDFAARWIALAEQAKVSGPYSVVIKQGAHWIVAVIGPSSRRQGKVDVVIFDSLHGPSSEPARNLNSQIAAALGQDLANYTHAGENVQGNTNGCGPFCARALSELDKHLGDEPLSMGKVAELLLGEVQTLRSWSSAQLEGVVAGWRAKMLGNLEAQVLGMSDAESELSDASPAAWGLNPFENSSPIVQKPDGAVGSPMEAADDDQDPQSVNFYTPPRKTSAQDRK